MSTQKVRINKEIRSPELRVIGADGANMGVVKLEAALDAAKAASLDLIEISPGATPPVAKIMDYGKFQYEQQKKDREIRAKSHITETKSVQIEVGTGENDLLRKARQSAGWLKEGHRVRVELFLKGRYKYMDEAFLKERLNRFVLLVPEEYRIAENVQRGPKGFTVILEKAGKAKN
ncbi:MAG: translation initiation factor IF-3 [Patescibacteria group bacterium]|nr:translation initiation factor IF-3 [Patescibacteria group bacterium]